MAPRQHALHVDMHVYVWCQAEFVLNAQIYTTHDICLCHVSSPVMVL